MLLMLSRTALLFLLISCASVKSEVAPGEGAKSVESSTGQEEDEVVLITLPAGKQFKSNLLPKKHRHLKCDVCSNPLDGIVDLFKTSCEHFVHAKCLNRRQSKGDFFCPHCSGEIGEVVDGVEKSLSPEEEKDEPVVDQSKIVKLTPGARGQSFGYENLPEERKSEVCSICGDAFANTNDDLDKSQFYQTECRHYFHSSCLDSWQDSGRFACPVCKTEIEKMQPPEPQEKNIVFDIDKMQMKSFIELISDLKQMNYIQNPDANNFEVGLSVREPLTADQAYNVFLSVLKRAGFAHVKVGDVYKIVKNDMKFSEPLPIFIGRPSCELPESDKPIRFVTFLKNIGIGDVVDLMKAFLSNDAKMLSLQNLNGFVISDTCANIKAVMRIINLIDNEGPQEMVSIIKLQETNANDIKDLLDKLMKQPDGNSAVFRLLTGSVEGGIEYFPAGIKIIPEERTNSLILLGLREGLQRVEDFIVNVLDKGLLVVDTPLHIYDCQYMEAESLRRIVDKITKGSANTPTGKYGGVRGGYKYFGPMEVDVDQTGNSLIVACQDKKDWQMLHKMLVDLDKPQPQVSISTLMVEITNQDTKKLGGQSRNFSEGVPIPSVNYQSAMITSPQVRDGVGAGGNLVSLLGNIVSGVKSLSQGEFMVTLGSQDNVWSILRAVNRQLRTSVITKPSILVSNRAEGVVSFGGTKMIVGDTTTDDNIKGYKPANVATKVSYRPTINQEGLISLDINIDISDFTDTTGDNTVTKNIATKVTVADGQVAVMGGFVKTKASEAESDTPILGKIPIFRWLFRHKDKTVDKNYTFFFVTANIQKPRKTPGTNLYTKMKLHQAYNVVEECVEAKWGDDPIHNKFFNYDKEDFAHKVVDFANARYQPNTVDIANDPYYRVIEKAGKKEVEEGPEMIKTLCRDGSVQQYVRPIPKMNISAEGNREILHLSPYSSEDEKAKAAKLKDLLSEDFVVEAEASCQPCSKRPEVLSKSKQDNADVLEYEKDSRSMLRGFLADDDEVFRRKKRPELSALLNDENLGEPDLPHSVVINHSNDGIIDIDVPQGKEFFNFVSGGDSQNVAANQAIDKKRSRVIHKTKRDFANLLMGDDYFDPEQEDLSVKPMLAQSDCSKCRESDGRRSLSAFLNDEPGDEVAKASARVVGHSHPREQLLRSLLSDSDSEVVAATSGSQNKKLKKRRALHDLLSNDNELGAA